MRSESATDEPATVARPGATDISTMPDDVPQTEGQAQQTTTTSPDSSSIAAANEKTPQDVALVIILLLSARGISGISIWNLPEFRMMLLPISIFYFMVSTMVRAIRFLYELAESGM